MPPKVNDVITSALADLKDEIKSIHTKLDSHYKLFTTNEKKMKKLESSVNDIEQHQRGHNIRIFGLALPSEDSNDPLSVSQHVYSLALKPILEIACEKKSLPSIPSFLETIDISHTLPSRDNTNPPIIVRLRSKLLRLVIMRHKKSFFTNNNAPNFSITDDLTRLNAMLLKQTRERSDVSSAWSLNGKIKYKVKSDPVKVLTASINSL